MMYSSGFAPYYDTLNADNDPERWVSYLQRLFASRGKKPESMVDLACGTGSLTVRLAKAGYDMIGIDLSCEMLDIAQKKAREQELDILYLNQDITRFELYGTVDAAICCLDSVNYILEKRALLSLFRTVLLYLNPGGLFVFDINSPYKYGQVYAQEAYLYDYGDLYCGWQNHYDRKSRLCQFDITVFAKGEQGFERFDETHLERCYEPEEINVLLQRAGFHRIKNFGEFTLRAPKSNCERIFVLCEKPGGKA